MAEQDAYPGTPTPEWDRVRRLTANLHDHREYVEGCVRCDLSRAEVEAMNAERNADSGIEEQA